MAAAIKRLAHWKEGVGSGPFYISSYSDEGGFQYLHKDGHWRSHTKHNDQWSGFHTEEEAEKLLAEHKKFIQSQ